jgi:DNA-binding NarL/FixJ family response regulator
MPERGDGVEAAIAAFADAAFAPESWASGLAALTTASGARSGQVVGWASSQIPVVLLDRLDPDLMVDWVALGGPRLDNPLVRAGVALPVLGSVAEHEVVDEDFRRRSDLWQAHHRFGIPHVCSTKVWSDGERHLMISVMQAAADGPFGTAQREVLQRVLPAAAASARIAQRLGEDMAATLAQSFDRIRLPVFVLDGLGRTLAASEPAEALLRSAGFLRLQGGVLRAAAPESERILSGAVARLLAKRDPASTELDARVRVRCGPSSLGLHLARLPARHFDGGLSPRLLVIADDLPMGEFTPAEGEVLTDLLAGRSAVQIARRRNVSVETVRTQVRAIYQKVGVHNRAALVARFASPGGGEARFQPLPGG